MENELLDADLLEAPTVPSSRVQDQKTNTQTSTDPSVDVADMPSVPEGKVNVPAASSSGETAAEKEARELKELEALMGM